MGKLESNNNYSAKNRFGYLGKYQMGKIALYDLGLLNKKLNWTGKFGINSQKDFLNSPKVQEKVMTIYTKKNLKYLKNKGTFKYIGKTFKNIKITKTGLLACAHLLGAGGTNKMLNTGIVGKDGFGTKGTKYLNLFKNVKID